MHRFFVEPEDVQQTHAQVRGEVARQVARVLRLRVGDGVVLLDNTGWEYVVTLQKVSPFRLEAEVVEKRRGMGDPGILLTLYQGLPKGDKLEMVLQKGTEIGISAFVPVLCHRSIPHATEGWADAKYPRWRRILKEAAEQSGRALIPTLEPLLTLKEAVASSPGVRLLAWEGEQAAGFREILLKNIARARLEGLSLFVGPEGGLTSEEVECAREAGVIPVSLGQRILRGETAGLAMSAAVMYQVGELGH